MCVCVCVLGGSSITCYVSGLSSRRIEGERGVTSSLRGVRPSNDRRGGCRLQAEGRFV